MISPHCDDAVLSLGAVLASRHRSRARTTVLTVLAGDPASSARAGPWDARAGFTAAAEATHVRRAEDIRACRRVGAVPVHVDGTDEQYPDTLDDEELWDALSPHLGTADLLLPGHPLQHPDHRRVTRLLLRRLPSDRPVRLYLEEPYATWLRWSASPPADAWNNAVSWARVPVRRRDVVVGLRAARCYGTQLPLLGEALRRAGSRRLGADDGVPLLAGLARAALQRGPLVTPPAPAGRLLLALGA